MITDEQKEYLLPFAYNAALRAGAAILDIYLNSDIDINISLKTNNTPITEADRRAHVIIREYLGLTRIPLLSEEGREMYFEERKDWDLFWMVDPLDGTKEFIKGNGEFTVNIALIVDKKPYFGVMFVPYKKKIYFSLPGAGSFRKCEVESDSNANFSYQDIVSDVESLPIYNEVNSPVRVLVSRSHYNEDTSTYIEELKKTHPNIMVIEQGSSYKFCLIAEGSGDFYPRTSDTYEWDTAAGESILEYAGGETRTMNGERLTYNEKALINPHFTCRSKWFKR